MAKPALTPEQVERIRAAQGTMTAQEVGALYSRTAEVIRRIWRREVYAEIGGTARGPTPEFNSDALVAELQALQEERKDKG